jgi:hypothetical protein
LARSAPIRSARPLRSLSSPGDQKRDIRGYFWTLQNANNETLCHSEVYVSKQGGQNGINAVRLAAPTARAVDRT